MAEYKYCTKHSQYREYNRTNFGICIYCIFDDHNNYRDFHDESNELVISGSNVMRMGYLDGVLGLVYEAQNVQNVSFLYDIYMNGVKMWKEEIVELPKYKKDTFPTGYNQEKYDQLKAKIQEIFDDENSDGDYMVDIDTLEIINAEDISEKEYRDINILCSRKAKNSKKYTHVLHVLYNMLYEDRIVE